MNMHGCVEIIVYFLIILCLTAPVGAYMAKVFSGDKVFLSPFLRPLEKLIYRSCRVDESKEMNWREYSLSMLIFSFVGLILTFALLRLQGVLPLNPQGFGTKEITPDLAFNTAVSFTTNTNWQAYVPEATLSYFSNMVSLAIHNWMSSAVGLAIALAFVRGFARSLTSEIGNFWVDVVRSSLYVLFPLALISALLFVYTGVPQTFDAPKEITTLEGQAQVVPLGPVASQEAIKQVGTNGGGFFNANSAHPFENPSPASNTLTIILIFLVPAGLTSLFGRMVGDARQGWAIFAAMSMLFLLGAFICNFAEQQGNPHFTKLGVDQSITPLQAGGNMEGKEVRFGISSSTLFATVTTGASCGAVNSMHDSFTPLGGLVPIFNMLTGEVIFGGVGAGLYGMLMYAVIAVFIAGLMVGRTPEYLGKKIGKFEIQMAMLAVLVLSASILGFSALSLNLDFSSGSSWNRVGNTATYLGASINNLNNSG